MTGDKKKPFKDKADSECRFRLLVMNAPFGFLELNTDGKITFANDSFHEMHGYSPGELIGADVKNFASTEEEKQKLKTFWKFLTEKMPPPAPYEGNSFKKNGEAFDIKVIWKYAFDENGDHIGFSAVTEDVTQLRNAASRLADSQKMRAVKRLSSGISHEFSNAISGISALTSVMKQEIEESPSHIFHEYLDQMNKQCRRLEDFSHRLKSLGDNDGFFPGLVPLKGLCREVCKNMNARCGENYRFKIKEKTYNPKIYLDYPQIHDALIKICENAAESMPEGGETLLSCGIKELDEKNIPVRSGTSPGSYAYITVKDHGRGIPETERDKVIEPFYTTKKSCPGAGMGLSIVFSILRNHDANIEILSEIGKGTEITMLFPVKKNQELSSKDLLLAEPDENIRNVMEKFFEDNGYEPVVTGCHKQADKMIKELSPAVMIVDFSIIWQNDSLLYELTNRPENTYALITGTENDKKNHFPESFYSRLGFITKPYEPHDLLCKIKKEMNNFKGE